MLPTVAPPEFAPAPMASRHERYEPDDDDRRRTSLEHLRQLIVLCQIELGVPDADGRTIDWDWCGKCRDATLCEAVYLGSSYEPFRLHGENVMVRVHFSTRRCLSCGR